MDCERNGKTIHSQMNLNGLTEETTKQYIRIFKWTFEKKYKTKKFLATTMQRPMLGNTTTNERAARTREDIFQYSHGCGSEAF